MSSLTEINIHFYYYPYYIYYYTGPHITILTYRGPPVLLRPSIDCPLWTDRHGQAGAREHALERLLDSTIEDSFLT